MLHSVTPKGSRMYAAPILSQAVQHANNDGSFKDGKLQMTREEAMQLDAISLGRMLRQLLTGARPNQSVMEAIADEQRASCVGCLLLPVCGQGLRSGRTPHCPRHVTVAWADMYMYMCMCV